MAISILETFDLGPRGVSARVRHHGSDFIAILVGKVPNGPMRELLVDFDYETVMSVRTLHEFTDEASGIWQAEEGHVIVRGRVCQVLDTPEGALVDLYLRNGCDFLSILQADTDMSRPNVEDGLEVLVEGLRVILPEK